MARWKPVKGYEGLYAVSDRGEVMSLPRIVKGKRACCRRLRILSQGTRGQSYRMYKCVQLSKNGKSETLSVHRLVAEAFIENPNNYPEVNHIDNDPFNNKVENLEWCTRIYNIGLARKRRVYQIDSGEIIGDFESVNSASEKTGIGRTCISNALKGWSQSAGGYKWRYANE